jgi:hypothetical protein
MYVWWSDYVAGQTVDYVWSCSGDDHSVYCPVGSTYPTPVTSGYFTVGTQKSPPFPAHQRNYTILTVLTTAEYPCKPGYYCPDNKGER